MKKNLMKVIKVLSLCLVLSLFAGIAIVDAQSAPANNVYGPLHVGPMQSKSGSLRITEGGFRLAGPGLFDDIVVIGYSDGKNKSGVLGNLNTPNSNISSSTKNTSEKVGFFTKLAKFFGLNTEKAFADILGAGNFETGGITPSGSCNPACTGYSTCQLVSAPNNYACILPACTLNCTSGSCVWGSNGMYCEGITPTGGEVGAPTENLTELESTTYHLTVNGNSNFKGNTSVTGNVAVSGGITSGGKNVCLQDGTNCVAQTTSNRFWGIFTVKGGSSIPQNNGSSNCLRVNPISNFCGCSVGTHSLIASYYNFSTLSHQPGGYNGGSEYKLFTPNGLVTPDDFTNHNPNGGLLIAPSGLQREEVYMCTN